MGGKLNWLGGKFTVGWQFLVTLSPRRATLGAIALLIALSAVGAHCHSTTAWSGLLANSPNRGLVVGQPRPETSDHWMVQIPMALSQRLSSPPFAVESPLLGPDTTDLRVIDSVPIAHWMGLFRPDTWGYFVSPTFGITWQWWSHIFGILLGTFLVAMAVTEGQSRVSFFTALAVACSPYFLAWAYRYGPLPSHAMLGLYCGYRFLTAPALTAKTYAFAAGAWWNLTGLALFLYPPFQLCVGYLTLFLLMGLLGKTRLPSPRRAAALRVALTLVALACVGALIWRFAIEASETIDILANTDYPGQRRVSGGDRTPGLAFLSWAAPNLWVSDWSLIDQSRTEASRFLYTFPLVAPLALWQMVRTRKPEPVPIALLAFIALWTTYAWFGWPEDLAKWSGWAFVPAQRANHALGFADAFLLAWWLTHGTSLSRRGSKLLGGAAFVCGCLAVGFVIEKVPVPSISIGWALVGGALIAPIGVWISVRQHALPLVLAAFGVVSFGADQNPLTDGTSHLLESPLLVKVRELDAQLEKDLGRSPVWVTFGTVPFQNVPRLAGAHSITGTHYVPQMSLWETLDPEHREKSKWNRYAHVLFSQGDGLTINVPQPDVVEVTISPKHRAFKRLAPDIIMVNLSEQEVPGYKRVAALPPHYFYIPEDARTPP